MSNEYHSNYFEQGGSHRAGLKERLDILVKKVKNQRILDIGCSGGYFDFGLMDRRKDIHTILAIDKEPDLIQGCEELRDKHLPNDPTQNKFIHFRTMDLEDYIAFPSNASENGDEPNTCLYMSVHHHVMQQWGHDIATFILRILSYRFDQMIFDMGQKDENCKGYEWWDMLPETDDSLEWTRNYILEYTRFETVEVIGSTNVHGVKRWLFNLE